MTCHHRKGTIISLQGKCQPNAIQSKEDKTTIINLSQNLNVTKLILMIIFSNLCPNLYCTISSSSSKSSSSSYHHLHHHHLVKTDALRIVEFANINLITHCQDNTIPKKQIQILKNNIIRLIFTDYICCYKKDKEQ